MIANLGISTSAILAADQRQAVTAINVANVSNPSAPRGRVDLTAAAGGTGVQATTVVEDPSSGDLVDDMTDMSLTGVLYSANLAVLRTQDETLGSLFDERA